MGWKFTADLTKRYFECRNCGPVEELLPNGNGGAVACAKCKRAAVRKADKKRGWRRPHANRNIHQFRYKRSLSEMVMEAYGGKCACCGETEPLFLQIDHIFNDGRKHMREEGIRGSGKFYLWLRAHNYPKDRFQILCSNCNHGKFRNGGVCPHAVAKRANPLAGG